MTATLHHGDSLEVLRTLPDNSVDSICTDPPYGLAHLPAKKVAAALGAWLAGDSEFIPGGAGFMGARWDRFVPPPALWTEALRVLKPGGYLVSFAGTRTQDLMGMSIRLAGFLIRDQLQWVRSDVFPKTKHALKPGYEPIILAQKPLDGTIEQNIATWGTGGLDIDAVRVAFRNAADEAESKAKNQHAKFGTKSGQNAVYGDYSMVESKDYDPPGRWPTNVLFNEAAAAELDAAAGSSRSRKGKPRAGKKGDGWRMTASGAEYDDFGGPSRFYPVFAEDATPFCYAGRATAKERPVVDGVKHTTVKPLAVMSWLIELTTPPGGTVLDMFAGSGTTGEAAIQAGFDCVLIEGESAYIPLIQHRLDRAA